jgi:hypothetical protein
MLGIETVLLWTEDWQERLHRFKGEKSGLKACNVMFG